MSYVVARLTKSRAYWLMVTINEYGEINVEWNWSEAIAKS
jgi:hypothetical protein